MASGNGRTLVRDVPDAPVLTDDEVNAFNDLSGELDTLPPETPATVTLDITRLNDGFADCITVQVEGSSFTGYTMDLATSDKLVRELSLANTIVRDNLQLLGDTTNLQ